MYFSNPVGSGLEKGGGVQRGLAAGQAPAHRSVGNTDPAGRHGGLRSHCLYPGPRPRRRSNPGGYHALSVNRAIPAQIQTAYGINAISLGGVTGTGSGQTIAIVDAYDDPSIVSDEATFNTQFGLQQFNVAGGPTLPSAEPDWRGQCAAAGSLGLHGMVGRGIARRGMGAFRRPPGQHHPLRGQQHCHSDLMTAVQTAAAYPASPWLQ